MNNSTKIISLVVLVLILGGAGYFYYSESSNILSAGSVLSGTNSLNTPTTTASGPSRDQTLQRLNRLEDINIDTDFLSAQIFTSFENFGISIRSQPVGRDNPFIPSQVQIPPEITGEQIDFSETGTSSQGSGLNGGVPTGQSSIGTGSAASGTTSIDQLESSGIATTSSTSS
jgi:hypothetical protein